MTVPDIFLFHADYTRNMALPPSAYQQWKEAAPELVSIEVMEATRESSVTETQGTAVQLRRTRIQVEAKARVISVERTAAGLQAGAEITLRYSHTPLSQQRLLDGKWVEALIAGPSPIPILEKGDKVTAWLRQVSGADYEPAAEAESFAVIPPPPTPKTD